MSAQPHPEFVASGADVASGEVTAAAVLVPKGLDRKAQDFYMAIQGALPWDLPWTIGRLAIVAGYSNDSDARRVVRLLQARGLIEVGGGGRGQPFKIEPVYPGDMVDRGACFAADVRAVAMTCTPGELAAARPSIRAAEREATDLGRIRVLIKHARERAKSGESLDESSRPSGVSRAEWRGVLECLIALAAQRIRCPERDPWIRDELSLGRDVLDVATRFQVPVDQVWGVVIGDSEASPIWSGGES